MLGSAVRRHRIHFLYLYLLAGPGKTRVFLVAQQLYLSTCLFVFYFFVFVWSHCSFVGTKIIQITKFLPESLQNKAVGEPTNDVIGTGMQVVCFRPNIDHLLALLGILLQSESHNKYRWILRQSINVMASTLL